MVHSKTWSKSLNTRNKKDIVIASYIGKDMFSIIALAVVLIGLTGQQFQAIIFPLMTNLMPESFFRSTVYVVSVL